MYSIADNIVSALGFDTDQNFESARSGKTGVREINDPALYPASFFGAKIDATGNETFTQKYHPDFTFLENLFIYSIQAVLEQVGNFDQSRTILVLSTTKGNIDLLGEEQKAKFPENRIELAAMAKAINGYFDLPNTPVVVSNACISGLSAIITAKKLIKIGLYDHVIVTGGDLLSEFVVSGFHSLSAVSDGLCKPYDAQRKGINLGEACGTMFLSKNADLCLEKKALAKIVGGGQSNDANHISGPSRTGAGLKLAVGKALEESKLSPTDIGYISAHGTATIFNDEMEAIAFDALGLSGIGLNSLKGYFGHTLGAAGIIESIFTIRQLHEKIILDSKGFEILGVSKELAVAKGNLELEKPRFALKTTSGFGGCNAAVIFEKIWN